MRIPELVSKIEIPPKVEVFLEGDSVRVKGPKGEVKRNLAFPKIELKKDSNTLRIISKNATRREKTVSGTIKSHIKNMVKGVTEGHIYQLKICSGHFPMNVSISGDMFIIKNFLGEKVPRKIKIKEGAKVKIDGNNITVEGIDVEIAGQVAADIEQLSRITKRDIRIFQDGIYIVKKSKQSFD